MQQLDEQGRPHTIVKDGSLRGCRIHSPPRVGVGELGDDFGSILCGYQKGFAESSFHLFDTADRRSPYGNRHDHVAQLLNVKLNPSLQELLLLIHQETAVGISKELVITDR